MIMRVSAISDGSSGYVTIVVWWIFASAAVPGGTTEGDLLGWYAHLPKNPEMNRYVRILSPGPGFYSLPISSANPTPASFLSPSRVSRNGKPTTFV